MNKYAVSESAVSTWYVYRDKVIARDLSKSDAQLIARALNKLAEEEDHLKTIIDYKLKHGDMW